MMKIILKGILFWSIVHLTSCSNVGTVKNNPYFYTEKQVELKASAQYYELESCEEKEIKAEITMIKEYEEGDLYKLAIEPIGTLGEERLNIYLYVTEDKIYRLWSYTNQEDEIIEFYNDDKMLIKYLNTDEKLVENGEVVCQSEEVSEETEPGVDYSILYTEDKVIYSRCDKRENGEPGFYEWFTWEKGVGLVDYGSGFGAERDILYLNQITEVFGETEF